MKKILYVFLGLYLNQALSAPHLNVVSHYTFPFEEMTLVTQVVPLINGGYIVQKYGRIISLFNAQGALIKENEIGLVFPLYQTGTQLSDGRILFINTNSIATVFDENLNQIGEYEIPAQYPWAPCMTDNGKLVFATYRENAIVVMNKNGKFSRVDDVGIRLKKTYCLENNKVMTMSGEGLLSLIDLNDENSEIIFQKEYSFVENTLKVLEGKAHFLTDSALTILDMRSLEEQNWPNPQIEKFVGIDYFKDGRYALISSGRDIETGSYNSRLVVYSNGGEKLSSTMELETGASMNPQVKIINDRFIVTNHCSYNIVLYDFNETLIEVDRLPVAEWLCDTAVTLASGDLVFHGFSGQSRSVYQVKLGE